MLDRIKWTYASISQPVVEDLDPRSFFDSVRGGKPQRRLSHLMSRYRSSKCRVRSPRKACCARVPVMRMKNEFSHESGNVQWHIPSRYQQQMSNKSKMVNQINFFD